MRLPSPILSAVLGLLAASAVAAGPQVEVFKSPYCGCCGKWVEHLRAHGFEVKTRDVADVPGQRRALGMSEAYASCHTARVGGYLIEGHVPAADVRRLLAERPAAIGLAVPSMPPGSPGMEGPRTAPFETLRVNADGTAVVFARH